MFARDLSLRLSAGIVMNFSPCWHGRTAPFPGFLCAHFSRVLVLLQGGPITCELYASTSMNTVPSGAVNNPAREPLRCFCRLFGSCRGRPSILLLAPALEAGKLLLRHPCYLVRTRPWLADASAPQLVQQPEPVALHFHSISDKRFRFRRTVHKSTGYRTIRYPCAMIYPGRLRSHFFELKECSVMKNEKRRSSSTYVHKLCVRYRVHAHFGALCEIREDIKS